LYRPTKPVSRAGTRVRARRLVDAEQVELPLGPGTLPEPAAPLAERLFALGLPAGTRVREHVNRTVMLSFTAGMLRIHRGYAWAPERVLRAIVRFLARGTRRAERMALRKEFLAFPVEQYAPPWTRERRRERPRPGDLGLLHRLERLHERLNAEHFGGTLAAVPFRISSRMRIRLGELALEVRTNRVLEIAVSRRHLRHGWAEVEETVLHEMVHQWQAETGRPVDHGPEFRAKAAAVGATPRAKRRVG
jgi:hypothetical protein